MNRFHRWYCRTGHRRHAIQDQILPWALDGVALDGRVLEIGPGLGLTSEVLARRAGSLTALDRRRPRRPAPSATRRKRRLRGAGRRHRHALRRRHLLHHAPPRPLAGPAEPPPRRGAARAATRRGLRRFRQPRQPRVPPRPPRRHHAPRGSQHVRRPPRTRRLRSCPRAGRHGRVPVPGQGPRRRGVEVIAGAARLAGPRTVEVTTADGDRRLDAARGIALATGPTPRAVPVPGVDIDGERVVTSDDALNLGHVPARPVIIGASAVGVELASIWHAYGAEAVTVVEALPALVPREDADTGAALAKAFEQQGIDDLTGSTVTAADVGADSVRVTLGDGAQIEGDPVLVAVGRAPVTKGLALDDHGVAVDPGYITAAERIAGRTVVPIDYAGIPRVPHCHPEVASVGLTEAQLRDQGTEFEKVLTAADGGRVLGVHIVGPRATDIIGEAQLIYHWEALPTEVAQFIPPHPTIVEAIGEAHLAAGKPVPG